jgi:N4-gp56 family major capsid protein
MNIMYSKQFKNKFLSLIKGIFNMPVVFADSTRSTVGTTEGVASDVALTNAVRIVYSKEIEFKAMPITRFVQFATVKTELGKEPGTTISMMTYDNLKLGGKLTEGISMTTQNLSSSMKQITVYEQGNAVAMSEYLLTSSFDDLMATATNLLSRDYALVLDCQLRDVALSGTNRIYASKADGTKISARTGLDATCTLKVSTIKDGVEILATNNAPKREGAYYICFVHPHQSRGLRDDSAWIEASKYGAPEQLFTGEIGRIDDVRFIETTLMCNGAAPTTDPAYLSALKKDSVAAGNPAVNVFQATLFGDAYYGLAYGLPVELRDNGIQDFGRNHGLAWYAIFGSGILHNEYGVVIETA